MNFKSSHQVVIGGCLSGVS